jgi:hypothetical protein
MPSYLDFDSTKKFRNYLIGRTLNVPNGPQTQTSSNYSVSTLSDFSNVDPGDVQTNRNSDLIPFRSFNQFSPTNLSIVEQFNTVGRPRLGLYPYFRSGQDHGLISIIASNNFDNESQLFKFAADHIKNSPSGLVQARLQQNLYTATVGRVRLIDAISGNDTTAINLLTGREPLIEKNYKITVAKSLAGKAIDFVQTVAGLEFPFTEIPGDYLSNPANPINLRPEAKSQAGKLWQDVTGAIGSLFGIERRPKISRKPSDLMIEYLSDGQKSALYSNLGFSKYAPNYSTTARSQNSSKIFNFIDRAAQGVKDFLGQDAPNGVAYIGDDRGDDVKFAMNDFNDRPVRSPYYLSVMFDEVGTNLFRNERNISEGGSIGGKLTWISSKSQNKLGTHNAEYTESESSRFLETLSTNQTFKGGSILDKTQEILETLPASGGEARSHVANVIDQTSRIFRDGDTLMSRGSNIKYISKETGKEDGTEYCRVWTKDRGYLNYTDTMKRTGLIRKINDSVMSTPWNLNIAPMSNGNRSFEGSTNIIEGQAKKYMFSIENLAWKTSNKPGYTYDDLPFCERGPNGGRVMWFPPYDLKVNESNNATWETNTFIGRPEPIYTYQNTQRSGTISFKVIVDHPSILNLLIKDISDDEAEDYLNSFFAGCEEVDFYTLVRKYINLDRSDLELIIAYLQYYKDGKKDDQIDSITFRNIAGEVTTTDPSVVGGTEATEGYDKLGDGFSDYLYFENNFPHPNTAIVADQNYGKEYARYHGGKETYKTSLTTALNDLFSKDTADYKNDRNVIYGSETPTSTETEANLKARTITEIDKGFARLEKNFTDLTSKIDNLKVILEKDPKSVKRIQLDIESTTSFVADDTYNIMLSYRRSDSIIRYVLNRLSKNNYDATTKWEATVADLKNNNTQRTEDKVKVTLKDLGYSDEGSTEFKIMFTNKGEKAVSGGEEKYDCTNKELKTKKGLKSYAPITFFCRSTKVTLNTSLTVPGKPGTPGTEIPGTTTIKPGITEIDVDTKTIPRKPPLDVVKKLIMKALSECFYFKKLEETDPVVFSSLKEKLKYFHPAFHSMTPEGLNARLTFLQQCLRPGDTIPIKNIGPDRISDARNTTFGPPPVCVIRIGDFYHSKVVIKDLSIAFEDTTWDLNPEGIGVQPMLANVTIQVNFIGGQGMKEPVSRLQNALSSNFYANTEVYDYRAESTANQEELVAFNIDFLEKLKLATENTPTVTGSETTPEEQISGDYIGVVIKDELVYSTSMLSVVNQANSYHSLYKDAYNKLLTTYGEQILPLFISPTYRTNNKVDVQTTQTTSKQITLFGLFPSNLDFSTLLNRFSDKLLAKFNSSDHNEVLNLDLSGGESKSERSKKLLNPYIKNEINTFLDKMKGDKTLTEFEKTRNGLIKTIDGLNFVLSTNGLDAKIEKKVASAVQLANFVDTEFYSHYDQAIDIFEKNESLYTSGLNTDIDFKNPTITDDIYKSILSVILSQKGKVEEIKKLYTDSADKKFFDENTVEKIEKRLAKFIKNAIPDEKKLKYKEAKSTKTEYSEYGRYTYTASTLTSQQEEVINKIHTNKDNSTKTKLNFIR